MKKNENVYEKLRKKKNINFFFARKVYAERGKIKGQRVHEVLRYQQFTEGGKYNF